MGAPPVGVQAGISPAVRGYVQAMDFKGVVELFTAWEQPRGEPVAATLASSTSGSIHLRARSVTAAMFVF